MVMCNVFHVSLLQLLHCQLGEVTNPLVVYVKRSLTLITSFATVAQRGTWSIRFTHRATRPIITPGSQHLLYIAPKMLYTVLEQATTLGRQLTKLGRFQIHVSNWLRNEWPPVLLQFSFLAGAV